MEHVLELSCLYGAAEPLEGAPYQVYTMMMMIQHFYRPRSFVREGRERQKDREWMGKTGEQRNGKEHEGKRRRWKVHLMAGLTTRLTRLQPRAPTAARGPNF